MVVCRSVVCMGVSVMSGYGECSSTGFARAGMSKYFPGVTKPLNNLFITNIQDTKKVTK